MILSAPRRPTAVTEPSVTRRLLEYTITAPPLTTRRTSTRTSLALSTTRKAASCIPAPPTLDSGPMRSRLRILPFGLGTVAVTALHWLCITAPHRDAGIANQGTRLQVQISNIPTGATVLVPDAMWLTNGSNRLQRRR